MRKHGSIYQYHVLHTSDVLANGEQWTGWVYEIYTQNQKPELIRESNEWFDSEAQAGFATIGHISLLENGEG